MFTFGSTIPSEQPAFKFSFTAQIGGHMFQSSAPSCGGGSVKLPQFDYSLFGPVDQSQLYHKHANSATSVNSSSTMSSFKTKTVDSSFESRKPMLKSSAPVSVISTQTIAAPMDRFANKENIDPRTGMIANQFRSMSSKAAVDGRGALKDITNTYQCNNQYVSFGFNNGYMDVDTAERKKRVRHSASSSSSAKFEQRVEFVPVKNEKFLFESLPGDAAKRFTGAGKSGEKSVAMFKNPLTLAKGLTKVEQKSVLKKVVKLR